MTATNLHRRISGVETGAVCNHMAKSHRPNTHLTRVPGQLWMERAFVSWEPDAELCLLISPQPVTAWFPFSSYCYSERVSCGQTINSSSASVGENTVGLLKGWDLKPCWITKKQDNHAVHCCHILLSNSQPVNKSYVACTKRYRSQSISFTTWTSINLPAFIILFLFQSSVTDRPPSTQMCLWLPQRTRWIKGMQTVKCCDWSPTLHFYWLTGKMGQSKTKPWAKFSSHQSLKWSQRQGCTVQFSLV